jgi:cell division topological specificity factor
VNLFSRFFKPSAPGTSTEETSKNIAKDRLKLALTYDRGGLAYGTIEQLRDEIIAIIAKHLAISEEEIEINFDSSAEYDKLIASIPLRVGGQRPRPAETAALDATAKPPAPATPAAAASTSGSAQKISKKRRHR